VASDVSWGYRTRPTGMRGKERRGGVEMLGRVDELTDGRFGSVDAATEGVNRSTLEIPLRFPSPLRSVRRSLLTSARDGS
jgi:hypothetical protein